MSLQTSMSTVPAPPKSLAATNSAPATLPGDNQATSTKSFGRILRDRMTPPGTGPAAKEGDRAQPAAETRSTGVDEPATKQSTTGNSLPGESATAGKDATDLKGHKPEPEADDAIGIATASGVGAVAADLVSTTGMDAGTAALGVDGAATVRSIAADVTTAVTGIPGSQASGAEPANGLPSAELQGSITSAAVATTTTAIQTTAMAPAVSTVTAGGKDAGSASSKNTGMQQVTTVATIAGRQAKLQTTSEPGITVQQNVPSSAITSSGKATPVQGQAETVTTDQANRVASDTSNTVLQAVAGSRTAPQQLRSTPDLLLTPASRINTRSADGSGTVPAMLSNSPLPGLSSLATTTTSTVLTMPVAVQPGDPRWAQAFTDRVVWLAQGNVQAANIRLNPPELGLLDIRIRLQHDQASILIVSPNQTVRHVLEATLPQLRQQFDNMGFVDVQAQVADQQPQQRDQNAYYARGSNAPDELDGMALEQVIPVAAKVSQGLLDLYI
ncbi:MAG TPA: hypothetical protein ENI62_12560 [Gammaproteobacteria bacterium]|nr:hypothetical protein [Gammaproteobacteria bacterium]